MRSLFLFHYFFFHQSKEGKMIPQSILVLLVCAVRDQANLVECLESQKSHFMPDDQTLRVIWGEMPRSALGGYPLNEVKWILFNPADDYVDASFDQVEELWGEKILRDVKDGFTRSDVLCLTHVQCNK